MARIDSNWQPVAPCDNTRQLGGNGCDSFLGWQLIPRVAIHSSGGNSFLGWQLIPRVATHSSGGNSFLGWQPWRRLATDSQKGVSPASAASALYPVAAGACFRLDLAGLVQDFQLAATQETSQTV